MVQRREILAVARWLIVFVIFFFIARSLVINREHLGEITFTLRPLLILASTLLICLNFFFYAVLWHYLTKANNAAIGFHKAVTAWFYSMLGKYVPGKVVLWAGRVYYYKQEGRSIKKVSFCFTLELALQFLSSLLIIVPALSYVAPAQFLHYRVPLLMALVTTLMVVNPKGLELLLNLIFKMLRKEPVTIAMRSRDLYLLLTGYVLNGLLLGAAFFLFVNGFYPVDSGKFIYLTGAFLFAGWAGILSLLAPAGLGVREGVLLIGLQIVMPNAVAAIVVLAARLWATIGELISVLAVFISNKMKASA